jgi:dihydropteroate synthase-like protein
MGGAAERILFLTGRLAEKSLRRVLQGMSAPFDYEVLVLSIQVAGLMTAEMIARRLPAPVSADRILVPGRCRGDLSSLSRQLGVPVMRGPDDLKDLPKFFGREQAPLDLSRHDVRIFAEIVDAPNMSIEAILDQAADYRGCGADVIDLGCLPQTPFPHLEETVSALRQAGFAVSVDSMDEDELLRAGRAGAGFLLSLKEETLALADEVEATPVLIPSAHGDLPSLYRAIEVLHAKGRPFLVDPILDPLHVGFVESLMRYRELRTRFPEVPIMMGTGNVTELTDADTPGMQALLMGIVSELRITNILTTQVSAHCAGVVREADAARRLMFAARQEDALPRGFGEVLLALRSLDPFPYSAKEIAATAAQIKDPSFRVQISPDGLHIYNRDGMRTAADPFKLLPLLGVERDGAHAFYLGVELARAQIAWQLGKRYVQDQELEWGPAQLRKTEDEPAKWVSATGGHRTGSES